MRTMYNIEDRPTDPPTNRPTDLAFCKILNGHISATGHLIHFMFGSRVGFSGTADRMALFPVGPNPRWRHLGKFQMAISPAISNGHISGTGRPIDFVFDPRVGFSGMADRMELFPAAPNRRWWPFTVFIVVV